MTSIPFSSSATEINREFYALGCGNETEFGRLSKLNADFDGSTEIGSFDFEGHEFISCAGPGAYNPVDGYLYWVSWTNAPGILIKTDPMTGESTVINEFTVDGAETNIWVYAIAIDREGNAYATMDNLGVYRVNLETADLTEVVASPIDEPYGFAYDYSTEKWIIVRENRTVFEFDPVAQTVTQIIEGHYFDLIAAFGKNIYALVFDINGDAYDMDGSLTKVSASDYTKTSWSDSTLNLLGVAAYSESIFLKIDFPAQSTEKFEKRIWAIEDGKITSSGKTKIRQISADRNAGVVVCSVRKKRDFSVSFKKDKRAAKELAKSVCRIAKVDSPEAQIKTYGWVVGKRPVNTVLVQFKPQVN